MTYNCSFFRRVDSLGFKIMYKKGFWIQKLNIFQPHTTNMWHADGHGDQSALRHQELLHLQEQQRQGDLQMQAVGSRAQDP